MSEFDNSLNNATEVFEKDFNKYLEKGEQISESENDTDEFSIQMEFAGISLYEKGGDVKIASQYFFLAGISTLYYAKKQYPEPKAKKYLKLSKQYFKKAIRLYDSREYRLMLSATRTLLCRTPQQCINEGTVETEFWESDNKSLFNEERLIEFYESCRIGSIVYFDDLISDACVETGDYNNSAKLFEELWLSAYKLTDPAYHMVSAVELFLIYYQDSTIFGKLSTRCARYLNEAFLTEGFSFGDCDLDNFFDERWLISYVNYAISLVQGTNPYKKQDISRGLSMLKKAADLAPCTASDKACGALGYFYEDGYLVDKDLYTALSYFSRREDCFQEDIERISKDLDSCNNLEVSSQEILSDQSSYESEYTEEVRICLKNGEITNGERRLLEKLREKLGISEARAIELERQLMLKKLSAEEIEYLEEYRECLAESGFISSSERRLLNRLRTKLNISEERAKELENLVKN